MARKCLANFNFASYEQKVYKNSEIKAKMKYEKKITKCFKSNCKPLFNNLKSKNTFRKSVNELHESDGSEPKSPLNLYTRYPIVARALGLKLLKTMIVGDLWLSLSLLSIRIICF